MNIVFALDISKSMLAPVAGYPEAGKSCSPTRLQRATEEILNFVDILEERLIDKAALVVFARYAYPAIAVFTDDFSLFRKRIHKEVQLENVLTMAEGSNQWAAVDKSLQVFDRDLPYQRLLIVLTDGEPAAPPEILAESKAAALSILKAEQDINLYIVGLGEQGKQLPVPMLWKPNGYPDLSGGYMAQSEGPDQGRVMTTVTDRDQLQKFA